MVLDIAALVQVRTEGEGARVMLFIHGWPDDYSLWAEQIAYFSKRGYLCVAVTLPHCGGRDQATKAGANTWGYDFPELADLVAAAAGRELERLGRPKRFTLVIHDWGAVTGFYLQQRHTKMVDRIVALDVGPPFQAKLFQAPIVIAIGVIYQYALAVGFLLAKLGPIGRFFGDALVRFMARVFKNGRLGVFKPLKNSNVIGNRVTADGAFFYWHFHASYWLRLFGLRSNPVLYKSINDMPSCPCLFFHGANKAFPFHPPWWESALKKRADCEVVGLPAGHWIQHEASPQLNERIEAWLGAASSSKDGKGASL